MQFHQTVTIRPESNLLQGIGLMPNFAPVKRVGERFTIGYYFPFRKYSVSVGGLHALPKTMSDIFCKAYKRRFYFSYNPFQSSSASISCAVLSASATSMHPLPCYTFNISFSFDARKTLSQRQFSLQIVNDEP